MARLYSIEAPMEARAQAAPEPRHLPRKRPGPAGGKRDRNRRKRTQELALAALELFLEHGIWPVTIEQIVSGANMAKGSFYRYYKDKTEVVETLVLQIAPRVRTAIDDCIRGIKEASDSWMLFAAYRQLGEDLLPVVREHPDTVLLLLQESRAPATGANAPMQALAREITEKTYEITEAAHSHGLLKSINPHISGRVVLGAIEKVLFDYLRGELVGNPADFSQDLVAVFLTGFLSGD